MNRAPNYAVLLAVAISFVTAGMSRAEPAPPAPALTATFGKGASSTGWIPFETERGNVFVPARVNGKNVRVWLNDGAPGSSIDKEFAASIGLYPKADEANGPVRVQIQIGNLTLTDTPANPVNLGARRGPPFFISMLMGDDLFAAVAVDIDFAHRRIAFRVPASVTRPKGAVELPLVRSAVGTRAIPLSIENGPEVPFEVFLGDPAPLTVYEPYYKSHNLLEDRPSSVRLGGGLTGARPEEFVATIRQARLAGMEFDTIPGVFPPNAARGSDSDAVSGNIGSGMLSRFRVIFDYTHDHLYLIPNSDFKSAPFEKERIGLSYAVKDGNLIVDHVYPGSPALAAGFKLGDAIAKIEIANPGQPSVQAWPKTDTSIGLRSGVAGAQALLTMADGQERRLQLADFF